jgi:hypothetical protein
MPATAAPVVRLHPEAAAPSGLDRLADDDGRVREAIGRLRAERVR